MPCRAYCAEKIIERGYGKPAQTQTLIVGSVRRSARDLSDEELLAIIDRGKQAKLIEQRSIEKTEEPTVEPDVTLDPLLEDDEANAA